MGREFEKIVQLIYKKSPLQKKKISRSLEKRDTAFFEKAEKFAESYLPYLAEQNISLEYAVDAYLKMCNDMLKSQIKFMRTGTYPVQSSLEAFEKVYNDEVEMKSYMIALATSQFLWPTHYDIFCFFEDHLRAHGKDTESYLEIGPGHGLFLTKSMEYLPAETLMTVVDISPISIAITRSIVNYLKPNFSPVTFHNEDMLHLSLEQKYDFIVMGEVLEHVHFPERMLLKMGKLLKEKGRAFVSTCVNSPAIDHVYHFRQVEEIREMFASCGLTIISERVLPVEDLPMKEIINQKITINYCSILRRTKE